MLGYGYLAQLGGTQLREVAGRPAIPTVREVLLLLCYSNPGGLGGRQVSMIALWESAPAVPHHVLVYGGLDFGQLRGAQRRTIASRHRVLAVCNILLVPGC